MNYNPPKLQFETKNSVYLYHFHLFQDPEFIEEAKQFKEYLSAKYPNIISVGLYSDELLRLMGVECKDIRKIHSVADNYLIDTDTLGKYLLGFYDNGRINPKIVATSMTEEGLIQAQFSLDITRDEYYASWRNIWAMKPNPTKRVRGPQDWPLIYSIHKARRHNKTFKQIFTMYQAGKLYDYTGSTNQHKSEDELEKYFRMYAFTP